MTTLRRDLPKLKQIDIFYSSNMNDSTVANSPGLWKAGRLMHTISEDDHANVMTEFKQASMSDLLEVHNRQYVEDVLDYLVCNGHGTKSHVALDAILYQNGGFLAAVKHAVENKTVAFAPTSGFHHAGIAYGGAFCTFNALMIAAKQYVRLNDKSVIIIDGDAHWGDGCIDIIQDSSKATYSIKYFSTSRFDDPDAFICYVVDKIKCHDGLVLYQAGADCHRDDTYGAGNYDSEQMRVRDFEVFKACKEKRLPIVWNLAGGYGAPDISDTIRLHLQTWEMAKRVYCSDEAPALFA